MTAPGVTPAQLRLKAARPESKAFLASSSWYATTLGGDIDPIQRLALCQARIVAGLFTLIVRSASITCPAPSAACHSKPVAGQCLGRRTLPDVAPEVLVALGALTRLDRLRHGLQLVPRARGMLEAVVAQQVGAVLDSADKDLIGDRDQLLADRERAPQLRVHGGEFRLEMGAQVDEIASQYTRPDHIDSQHIHGRIAFAHEFSRELQLAQARLRNRWMRDTDSGLAGEGLR
jgi:hypothetical protein